MICIFGGNHSSTSWKLKEHLGSAIQTTVCESCTRCINLTRWVLRATWPLLLQFVLRATLLLRATSYNRLRHVVKWRALIGRSLLTWPHYYDSMDRGLTHNTPFAIRCRVTFLDRSCFDSAFCLIELINGGWADIGQWRPRYGRFGKEPVLFLSFGSLSCVDCRLVYVRGLLPSLPKFVAHWSLILLYT